MYNIYTDPLHKACEDNDCDDVRECLVEGLDINSRGSWDGTPFQVSLTPSKFHHWPVAERDLVVSELLEAGADITDVGINQWTPLHLASLYKFRNIVKLLLKYGANVNALDSNLQSPLHKVVEYEALCNRRVGFAEWHSPSLDNPVLEKPIRKLTCSERHDI